MSGTKRSGGDGSACIADKDLMFFSMKNQDDPAEAKTGSCRKNIAFQPF
jgi:hypothetical protein